MALRLRRGTDAERLTITPVESELIYTTDNKELFVGDGITVGGNKIGGIIPQFLSDLNNVDADSPQIGQVLRWDGDNWVAGDDTNGVVEGSNYRINIVGDDSIIIVDSETNTFTGNFEGDVEGDLTGSVFNEQNQIIVNSVTNTFTGTFVGDGSGLTNLPISLDGSGIVEGSNYRINIVDDGSTIMVNTSSGTFTGDGSGLTNLPTPTNMSILDLSDVFAFEGFTPDPGDILIYDGFNFVIQKITTIEGADSTIMVDTFNNTFTGNFVGDGSGLTNLPILEGEGVVEGSNYRINIIGDDSTIIVDTSTNTFTGNFVGNILADSGALLVNSDTNTFAGNFVGDVTGSIFTDQSTLVVDGIFGDIYPRQIISLELLRIRNDIPTSTNFLQLESNDEFSSFALIRNSNLDLAGNNDRYGQIRFGRNDINGRTDTTIISANEQFVWIFNGSDGIISESKVVTLADGDFGVGTTTPAEKLDVRGNIVTTGFIQFGNLTTTERNALTAANGMVIYNITDNKFQGYQNGNWINLDGSV